MLSLWKSKHTVQSFGTYLLRTVLALLAQFTVGLGRCLHETRLKQRLARLREGILQG